MAPLDPTMVADPTFVRNHDVPATVAAQLAGQTWVFQMYGIDTAYAWPDTFVVTNHDAVDF